MDKFMERAVQLAFDNVQDGGQPFGAVLMKDNEIFTEGVNELHKTHDVSGHAELLAIRRAQRKLKTDDLSAYTMYASGEPCPMCLTAMYFAGIEIVYYCASIEQAAQSGLGKSAMIYKELQRERLERSIKMEHMPLKDGQEDPMKLWRK
ncbi:nucleoside deaminase [Virgibacillus alimentarius]|uniref:tRNA(Arg) A34 adenosine deaminase TadA n=1 Tax=Virgibacillus alimentarius TaxID=698769 RepID=A0ABS4S6U5_9BACI|nr:MULTISPECIES: nucleoside deaminase [Virgibacillus]MBP2257226.1 tRNA(Arg) A34 adenosine deaminase TadA [Virgibacillus alimentarius]HLR67391.1 nucleoside deaminase [Virgibacillus sp.]